MASREMGQVPTENAIIGPVVASEPISLASVGYVRDLNINAKITAPTIDGYSLVGFIPVGTSSYRLHAPSCTISGGVWYADGYISQAASGTTARVSYLPVYTRS